MADASLCRLHADRPAVGTCDRCGSFGCGECLQLVQTQRLCPDCRARMGADLPPLSSRAGLAKLGLWGTGASGLLLSFFELAVPADGSAAAEDSPMLALYGLVALGYLAVFIVTIVLFCRWFHLAVRHAHARGVAMEDSPAAAVGSWFIPIYNLFRPFNTSRTMLSGLGRDAGIVGAWQGTWIAGNAISNVSSRIDNAALSIGSGALILVAAFLATRVVGEVTGAADGAATKG